MGVFSVKSYEKSCSAGTQMNQVIVTIQKDRAQEYGHGGMSASKNMGQTALQRPLNHAASRSGKAQKTRWEMPICPLLNSYMPFTI
jgi:hypothetical protein